MYKQNPELVRLLEPVVSGLGYELWGLEYQSRGRHALLRVYIDSDDGITLADCERVSEQVTGILDVNDPIRGSYELEISSPGLDRPLFTLDQVQRFKGYRVKLKLRTRIEGRRNLNGEIQEVDDDAIHIMDSGERFIIPADVIEKANIQQ